MNSTSGADIISDSLNINLPAESHGSIIPWVIALVSGVVLLATFLQSTKQIPATLEAQARSALQSSGIASVYPNVQINARGRELQLSGSIRVDQTTEPLHAQLEQIAGITAVRQQALQIIDPALQRQAETQSFQQALGNIDVSTVGFQAGSVRFTDASESALSQLLQLLKQYPNSRIRIEGHTDNTGADTINVRVSRERAAAVANYLMSRGVASDQLVVTGYGSTRPIADNGTEAGRSRNRRIEVNPVN